MTNADTIAAHIDTNWNAGSSTKPGLIDAYVDQPDTAYGDSGGLDCVLVLESTPHVTRDAIGLLHEHTGVYCRVHCWARTTADLKARLVSIITEVKHVLHSSNHLISGYTWHHTTDELYHIDKRTLNEPTAKKGPEAKAVLLFEGFQNGRGI